MTAEEFLKEKGYMNPIDLEDAPDLLNEYAKMHVGKALYYASEKAMVSVNLHDFIEDSWTEGDKIDKQSILSAYPEENFK